MMDGPRPTAVIAWLLAVVVPPAVAGGVGQHFVAHHAVWAVVIGVVYESVVAVGGFFAAVARDVSSRWQARLANRVDLFLQRKGPRFEGRYRQFVLDGLRYTDTKGLATVGEFMLEHDAVFVDVHLVPRPPQQIKPGILPELADDRTGRHSLEYFLNQAEPVVMAVVGAPGSGKTTLLRNAARQACQLRPSRGNRVRDIPILLYLRDHAATITSEPGVTMATLLRTTLGKMGNDEPPEWFEQQLGGGRCLILLDGLDEVARQEDRVKVSAWADAQVPQYPRSSFVISSRPQGYQSAPVTGAEIVQVCGFTTSQVETFVRGWYRAIERHSTPTSLRPAEDRAAKGADDLLQRLKRAPALHDLTTNPLLLTMIANVHRYRGALPGSRADLYGEICQAMLWRRQEAKQLVQRLSGDKKQAILRSLAYTMMERHVADLSSADVLTAIPPAPRRASGGAAAEYFLADVSSNGLLIERETGQHAFAHKTFQEYLAAAHIRDKGLVSILAQAVNDDWWAETTLLYAAKSSADPIVLACLEAKSAPAISLALDCVDQDEGVALDLRERLNALVASTASPDANPERRRLFSNILLRRYMRQYVRTSAGTPICPHPIPNVIYQLFLADTNTPKPNVSTGKAGIAFGMRNIDAAAFVQWAITISGEQQGYRLPLPAELNELASQQRIPALPSGRPPSAWTQEHRASAGSLPALWIPPSGPAPNELDTASMADVIKEDMASSTSILSSLLLLRSRLVFLFLGHVIEDAYHRAPNNNFGRSIYRSREYLKRALEPAGKHALILNFDLARALALDGHFFDGRDVDLDFARFLHSRHPVVGGLSINLARAFDQALRRAYACVSDIYSHLDQSPETADPEPVLADAIAVAHYADLDPDLGVGFSVHDAMEVSRLHNAIQSFLGWIYNARLGRVLSMSFTERIGSVNTPDWRAQFAATFTTASGVRENGKLSVDLESLKEILLESVDQLTGILNGEVINSKPPLWAARVALRLKENAAPIFDRTEWPTPEKATAIRIAALCLAGEADGMELAEIGDMFRQVAAGITLLARRLTDEQGAVIMLAAEEA